MEDWSQGLRKGTWTSEEDRLLKKCIETHGEGKWHLVPSRTGLNRCRKSCRLRWLNYLKPSIKRGKFSPEEIDLIIRLHKLLGNRWSLIAGRLPGRTANDVKNYWNSHISKTLDQSIRKNIEPLRKPKITISLTEPVQKIKVLKPRPQSFSISSQDRLLKGTPKIAFPGSNNNKGSSDIYNNNNNNNNNNNSNSKHQHHHNYGNVIDGGKTCNKDVYAVMQNVVAEGTESMWWERLLEESEQAAVAVVEEAKITKTAVEEAEGSWVNSPEATFVDVDIWNLLNA